MDKRIAVELLGNLQQRLRQDPVTGDWRIDGLVTPREQEALVWAVAALHVGLSENPVDPQPAFPLALASLNRTEPSDPDVVFCLDFGTAASKAFATRGSDTELIELAIGTRAGQVEPAFALISSIFITSNGVVRFGQRAVDASAHADPLVHRRFDSLKDVLCKEPIVELDDAALEREYNPTNTPLTKADVITLYLAYLTDMALLELEAQSVGRHLRRRFTLPILPAERRSWAERQLQQLLIRAQIVADTFSGRWADGIDVTDAHLALVALRKLTLPSYLVSQSSIAEPIAAVGSRVRNYIPEKESRRLLAIADVGAGTIDFSMFFERQYDGGLSYWAIPGTQVVLRQAGDRVDDILKEYVLEEAGVLQTHEDYRRVAATLSLAIRAHKESLFSNGTEYVALQNERVVDVNLDAFLNCSPMQEFANNVRGKFREMLDGAHASWFEGTDTSTLNVILTGGGASLPPVHRIEDYWYMGSRQIETKIARIVPGWVERDHPSLLAEFPRLAVAIGGASREIPKLATVTFEEFGGLPDAYTRLEIFRTTGPMS